MGEITMRKRRYCRILALVLAFLLAFAVPAAASDDDVVIVLDPGHGGIDWLAYTAFVDALKNGEEMPVDVYDAATWQAVSVLSEISIQQGGAPQAMPDFTRGKWMHRPRKDVCEF